MLVERQQLDQALAALVVVEVGKEQPEAVLLALVAPVRNGMRRMGQVVEEVVAVQAHWLLRLLMVALAVHSGVGAVAVLHN